MDRESFEVLSNMAAFAVVVDAGSFVEAAVKLGVSASAVSRQISKLEEVLSLRLLERSTRHLKLNEDGERIYRHCKELLLSSRRVLELKEELLKPQGLLRLSVPKTLREDLNRSIPDFLQQFPDINLRLLYDLPESSLIADEIDLGVWVTDSPSEYLVGRKLFKIGYALCASPLYLARNSMPVHPSALFEHNCIVLGDGSDNQEWVFSRDGERVELSIKERYCSNDVEAVLSAVIDGVGVACLPARYVDEAVNTNQLQVILPDWECLALSQGQLWLLYKPNKRNSQKLKVMVSFLLHQLSIDYDGTVQS